MSKKSLFALLISSALIMSMSGCGEGEQERTDIEILKQTTGLADYSAYVTLGQYTDLDIAVSASADVKEQLQERMDRAVELYNNVYAESEPVVDRSVVLGDTVNMDFTTTVNGEAVSALSGAGVSYGVGSEQIEKSLDEQMVGLQPGQSYDLNCTFGDDTDFAELAGQDVTFHVTINYLYGDVNTLEWGDEVVTALTQGKYTDADKYEEYLYQQIQEEANQQRQQEYADALWEAVLTNCTFAELPADVIEQNAESYYANQKAIFEYYATYYSYTYEEYMEEKQGMTDEQFHEKSYEYAQTELERIYTATTIFRELGMEMTDEEFSKGVAELVEQYGYDSSAKFVETYGEEYVREVLVTNKVEDYLLEHNHMVTEE